MTPEDLSLVVEHHTHSSLLLHALEHVLYFVEVLQSLLEVVLVVGVGTELDGQKEGQDP